RRFLRVTNLPQQRIHAPLWQAIFVAAQDSGCSTLPLPMSLIVGLPDDQRTMLLLPMASMLSIEVASTTVEPLLRFSAPTRSKCSWLLLPMENTSATVPFAVMLTPVPLICTSLVDSMVAAVLLPM